MMNTGFDREVHFEILEHIGVLSTHSTGWSKELNIVSWNGGQPKYDIRDWDLDHEHMSRGVTLHEKEMRQMFDLMKKRRLGNRFKKEEPPQPVQKYEEPLGAPLQQMAEEEPFDAPLPQEAANQEPLTNVVMAEEEQRIDTSGLISEMTGDAESAEQTAAF